MERYPMFLDHKNLDFNFFFYMKNGIIFNDGKRFLI